MSGFPIFKNFKNRRIKFKSFEDIEPHEILLDKLAKTKASEMGISQQKLEVPLLKNVLNFIFFIFLLSFFILFAKTFQLQIINGKNLSALAENNKFIISKIQAERGVIYDSNFNQLVSNLSSFDLICDRASLPDSEEEKTKVLTEISQILKLNIEDLEKEISENGDSQILIYENIDQQALVILETKINELRGFQIIKNPIRKYEDGKDFAHLIGYTNKIKAEELKANPEYYSIADYIGRDGLEKSYEEILRKNPGKLQIERDAKGNILSKEVISLPESGNSLVLWLDSDLQKKIKEELEKELQIVGAQKAAAIALDPKTGGILSLVSIPSFDNNLFQKGADQKALQNLFTDPYRLQPLFNRVTSGKYLTGSTIKPLIASAVLEEKIINPEKSLYCEGSITIPNPYNPAEETKKLDWTTHGLTDLRKALAESCDVYFYTVGGGYKDQKGLGPTKIKEYLDLFGWEEKTGIDLPGEATGFVPDKNWKKETWKTNWWDGDTYNLAIGQGFLQITPLEVVTSISSIANGGKLLQPQAVKSIVDGKKNVIQNFETKIIRENFIDTNTLEIVREGMRQAVTGVNSPQASAIVLNSLPVSSAAKTGTAEVGNDRYHNWVTVFAPYNDPKIILTVIIENIKGVKTAALPVAKEVLQWYFERQ